MSIINCQLSIKFCIFVAEMELFVKTKIIKNYMVYA